MFADNYCLWTLALAGTNGYYVFDVWDVKSNCVRGINTSTESNGVVAFD